MRPVVLVPTLVLVMGATAEYPALLEEDKSSFLLSLPNVLHAGPDDACNYLFNFRNFDGSLNRLVLNFTTDDHHPLFSVEKNFLPTTGGRAPPRIAALCRPPPPGQPFGGCDDTPEPPSGFPRYSRSLRSVDSSDCVSVPVPFNISDHKEAKVSLKLNAHDGLFTAGPEKIKILRGTPPIKLTNHDKPQYRPGGHAHFQLLLLDWRLRPLGGLGRSQTIKEAWVTNPFGDRVAQWRDTPVKLGVASFDFHIAEELVPFRDGQEPSTVTKDGYVRGDWKMHYKTDDFYHWEEFHVGDVSPLAKFDVDITAPEKIFHDENTISMTVCATYKSGTPLVEASVDAGLKAAMGINENSSRMAHALTDSRGCAVLDMIIRLEEDRRPVFINILINVTDSTSLIKEERSVSVKTTNMLVDLERIVKFDTIPANLSRTLVYRVTYFGEEGPVTNEVIEICTRTAYYPPTRNGFGVNTSSPLADFTYLLPKHELNKLSPELLAELKSLPLLWRVNHTEAERTEKQCRNITTDGEGIAKLKMTELSHRVHTVEVEGSDWPDLPWSDELRVMTSPSGSYLAFDVAEMPVKLPCHGDIRLPLLSTLPKESLVVQLQVIARDRVVASQTADLRSEDLVLHMVPEMSPKARLLVYSQLESGEVMADTVEMDVETCFPNEVTVDWTASNAAPDTAADLIVTAEPHSRCTIAVKDSGVGVRMRGRQPYELTRERTLSVFSRLHGDLEDTFLAAGGWLGNMMVPPPYRDQTAYTRRDEPDVKEYCAALEQKLFESLIRAGVNRTSLDNLVKGFKEQYGYVDKEDVTRVFSLHPNADAADVFRYAGMVPLANRGLRYSPCVKDEVESWHLDIPTRHKRESPLIQERPSHFYDARENVIYYETQTLDERGKGHVTLRLPGRATRWVATATCTHPQKGFGISEKVPIRATKLLFAEMSIPHSVKAGELLILPVTVFNNYDTEVSVQVTLDEPSSIFVGPPPHDRPAPTSQHLCIKPHRSEGASWPIKFSQLGVTNISVSLIEDGWCAAPKNHPPFRTTFQKSIVVRPDGFLHEDEETHFVCIDSGASGTVDVDLERPNSMIPDSAWLDVTVYGENNPATLELEDELDEPSGGAEPNMIAVVKNVYAHDYLAATQLLTTDLRLRIESNIHRGLRNALRYKREDKSYSAHGNEDEEGSLWLTMMTLKTFRDAAKFHPKVATRLVEITDSVNWIIRHQRQDGCFYPSGELLHQELMGGVDDSNIGALTAYVILSLDGLIDLLYIQLGLKSRAELLIQDLLKSTVTEGDWNVHWREKRTIYGVRTVADVEMTACITQSLIELSGRENMRTARLAVKWIIKQRSQMFFVSPQAAAASLQALAAFSRRTHSSKSKSTVSVTIGDSKPYYLHVDPTNRLLQQTFRVKDVKFPTRAHFEVTEGCVTLKTALRYASISKNPQPAFLLNATATERPSSKPGSTFTVTTCVAMNPTFPPVDLAWLIVDMPSGYVPVSASVRELRHSHQIKGLKIMNNDAVKVRLENISQKTKCISFRIVRETVVEDQKRAIVNVIDYFSLSRRAETTYTLQ